MRTVIYARFSSQLQNSRSIDDQIAVCRDRADREGWTIVDVYTDYAISGAAGISEAQRPGLAAMLARVEAGGVEQVLTESTDRIARHEGDSFAIRERLQFARARLFTLSDGEVTNLTGTIKGLMDAQFRKELGAKIKRGQRGTVAQGRSPAGIAYGYRTANRIDPNGRPVRGLRAIDEEQAEIVRRIFREYAAGISPRGIAQRLNADGIPGPRGGAWKATTIAADRTRGNGLIQNQLYIGRIIHNRTSKIVEPVTRSVRIRPNPPSDWIIEEVPSLRVIDDALWEAVQEGRGSYGTPQPQQARRPKHMLSGLGVCGVCGSGWIVKGNGYWACGGRKEGNNCANERTVSTARYEDRVLHGLRAQMLDPDLVAIFVKEYHEARARGLREERQNRTRYERRLAEASGKVDRLVAAISAGAGEFAEVREALQQARAERDAAQEALLEMEALPVVALHPAVVTSYRREVEELHAMFADPEAKAEAVPKLRSMIDRIVLVPAAEGRGVDISVEGRLAAMLAIAGGNAAPKPITITMERVKGIEPSS
ncbi:recombinase family protein [Sphingomonas sp. A2-49]|uniref:recombinase family protein n=1 Tax=Sphingomonas sp. A2-49 TaxID=1391375 RepID=UPI0021D23042|nr:recombinase family protein [Sphingomonas sp. A2-49]MCU6454325.1 recombinase family protein [Sphingomonas sp. A2-49]